MASVADIRHARVLELVQYNPDSGEFTWRPQGDKPGSGRPRARAGTVAGTVVKSGSGEGYVAIRIDGARVEAHRLVWFYCFGEWPRQQIDHRDQVKHNNRLGNLRDVPGVVNQQNRRAALSSSSTGLLGVANHKDGRYSARIRVNGKPIHLGCFRDPNEAHAAYIEAKRKLHEGCTL